MSSSEDTAQPQTAEFCGRYRLIRKLATGGMGQVYLASLAGAGGFEKKVAVKRLLPHLADDERFVAMFLNEARIAARLTHPNICQTYEVGETSGSYYIAMEYLDGLTCTQLLKKLRRRFEPGLVVALLRQAAEGLHSAHELRDAQGASLGVVHRDVTPSNLFICRSGIVKLLDFGVAKARDAIVQTQAGTLKGKFGYMSPEQFKALELDRRSDIFSLGIVAHELLTGRRLFRRESMYLTTVAVLEEPIPSLVDIGINEKLAAVVSKALSRDREQRYSTALEFADALAHSIDDAWSNDTLSDFLSDLAIEPTNQSQPTHTVTNTGEKLTVPIQLPRRRVQRIAASPPERMVVKPTLLRQVLTGVLGVLFLILVGVLTYYLVV